MASADPGSFRDPASHVIVESDRVVRVFDERGLEGWHALKSSDFYEAAVAEGTIIASRELSEVPEGSAGAITHPRLPFISYPHEWTFTMLKDAALLQLHLLEGCLANGLTIKDATPLNIQFVSGRPIFIDIGSFEAYRAGEPWIAYGQFTRQFLFPLMMRAWAGVPFQPWLRGDPEGPTAADMNSLLPLRRRISPAGFFRVILQARADRRHSGVAVRRELSHAGFSADMILNNVRALKKLVSSLEWDPGSTQWTDYQTCDHVERDRATKANFLRVALGRAKPGRVLDLGANDAYFSEIAAEAGAHTVAVDGDEGTLESVYSRSEGKSISVVVSELTNPSPSQGWAGIERRSLGVRAKPELVVAYGVIHHLIYTASIPPSSVLDWLRSFNCEVVLEFVAPADEMVAKLTANKRASELHPGRTEDEFRGLLAERFSVTAEETLGSGTRTLLALAPV